MGKVFDLNGSRHAKIAKVKSGRDQSAQLFGVLRASFSKVGPLLDKGSPARQNRHTQHISGGSVMRLVLRPVVAFFCWSLIGSFLDATTSYSLFGSASSRDRRSKNIFAYANDWHGYTLFKGAIVLRLVGAICFCFLSIAVPTTGLCDQLLNEVITSWKDRETLIKSAKISWSGKRTMTKGSLSIVPGVLPAEKEKVPNADPLPAEDLTYKYSELFAFDGDWIRQEYEGAMFHLSFGVLLPYRSIDAFGGNETRRHRVLDWSKPKDEGFIHSGNQIRVTVDNELLPIIWFLRPSQWSELTGDVLELSDEVDSQAEPVVPLIEKSHRAVYWVDPHKDFNVVTAHFLDSSGGLRVQFDINYVPHRMCKWSPSRWTVISYGERGALRSILRAAVNECEINTRLPQDYFQIDFPPGTKVADYTDGKLKVKAVDQEGVIVPAIFEPAGDSSSTLRRLSIWINLGVVVLLSGFLWRRRHSAFGGHKT